MDINITLLPETACVYLVSGEFSESNKLCIAPDEVVYLTVLPLDACFLPYTVKLIGAKVSSPLALICKIAPDEYILQLSRRSFVYSPEHNFIPSDFCRKFFYCVKGRHFAVASSMLSPELKKNLGEKELAAFFAEYSDLLHFGDRYYAVDGEGVGHRCEFDLRGDKIENISLE